MLSLKQVIAQKNSIPKIKDLLAACEAYEFDSVMMTEPSPNDASTQELGFIQENEKEDGLYAYGYRLPSNRSSHHR